VSDRDDELLAAIAAPCVFCCHSAVCITGYKVFEVNVEAGTLDHGGVK